MTFRADELEEGARAATGLDDFGSPYYREGLERTVDALNTEADLSDMGRVHPTRHHRRPDPATEGRGHLHQHPEIDDEIIGGPVFVIGLPRTGTTALSQLVAADPQFRSLRMWESQAPTPPPEIATQHPTLGSPSRGGPADAQRHVPVDEDALQLRATAATECQDLMGMSFRTFHFDGVVRVPGYLAWLMSCDMRGRTRSIDGCSSFSNGTARRPLAPQDPCPRIRARRTRRGLPKRQIHVEPPRSGQGDGFGVQPHPVRAQLEQ